VLKESFSMSTPVSIPVNPPQPNTEYYGIAALGLFQNYSRESYLAAFGVQAPPYDPSRLIKMWFDSAADTSNPANVSLYKTVGLDQSGNWSLQQMVIPASEAATVNLPGTVTYPPYVIAPTQATRGGATINPAYLSMPGDAAALMAKLGGSHLVDEGTSPVFPVIYPAGEPRRVLDFTVGGNLYNVGTLLAAENANGIGYPGQWDTSGIVTWVPDPAAPTGMDDSRAPRPMPVRSLLANEKFNVGLMGVGIVRTDLQTAQNQDAGMFTKDDRATLQRIYQIVSQLGIGV